MVCCCAKANSIALVSLSAVFNSMLRGVSQMKEQREKSIRVEGVGAGPIKEMLRFVNGGMPDFNKLGVPILGDILRLSHMYVGLGSFIPVVSVGNN